MFTAYTTAACHSLSPSICFVPSPFALFCFSFIASATTKRDASSGLHHFMSEHYRYLLPSMCRITFVDPSHDLFLNIAKSSWYAVELVSKDQTGSRTCNWWQKQCFHSGHKLLSHNITITVQALSVFLCFDLPHLVRPTVKIGRA